MLFFIIKEFKLYSGWITSYYERNNSDNKIGNFIPLFHLHTTGLHAKFTQDKAHSLVSGTKKRDLNEKGN
jgi:hypothetical protein